MKKINCFLEKFILASVILLLVENVHVFAQKNKCFEGFEMLPPNNSVKIGSIIRINSNSPISEKLACLDTLEQTKFTRCSTELSNKQKGSFKAEVPQFKMNADIDWDKNLVFVIEKGYGVRIAQDQFYESLKRRPLEDIETILRTMGKDKNARYITEIAYIDNGYLERESSNIINSEAEKLMHFGYTRDAKSKLNTEYDPGTPVAFKYYKITQRMINNEIDNRVKPKNILKTLDNENDAASEIANQMRENNNKFERNLFVHINNSDTCECVKTKFKEYDSIYEKNNDAIEQRKRSYNKSYKNYLYRNYFFNLLSPTIRVQNNRTISLEKLDHKKELSIQTPAKLDVKKYREKYCSNHHQQRDTTKGVHEHIGELREILYKPCYNVDAKVNATNRGQDIYINIKYGASQKQRSQCPGMSFQKKYYEKGEYEIPKELKEYIDTISLYLRETMSKFEIIIEMLGTADAHPISSPLIYRGYKNIDIKPSVIADKESYYVTKREDGSDCGVLNKTALKFDLTTNNQIKTNEELAFLRIFPIYELFRKQFDKDKNKKMKLYTMNSEYKDEEGSHRKIIIGILIGGVSPQTENNREIKDNWLDKMQNCPFYENDWENKRIESIDN